MFNKPHTGNNLAVSLQDVCREWNINDKKTALVNDNDKNMILAGVGSDTLNLASQKSFKVDRVSEHLAKVRKVVTFFTGAQNQRKFYVKHRPSYSCQTTS